MLGAGHPAKHPSINVVRELTRPELDHTRVHRGKSVVVTKLRDSHHMLARLCAMGLRNHEIRERTGFSTTRISSFRGDPAFAELVATYREMVNEEFREGVDDYFETVVANRVRAANLISEKLNAEDAEELPLNQLISVHADAADRTGYPKRTVATNINVDFAARLDQAIKQSGKAQPLRVVGELPSPEESHSVRTRTIDLPSIEEARQIGPVGTSEHLHAGPVLIRRRI